MEAYSAFAKVYDNLMNNVPYEEWVTFIDTVIKEKGISVPKRDAKDLLESERNLVLDMGCGTGVVTRMLYDKGYDVFGIDISVEMLDEARNRNDGRDILYLCQDMCELDLYSTIGTVVSTCDSINYLIEDEEIESCFQKVEKFLYPGGLFIFDFNTLHKYRDVIGDTTIAEAQEDVSFIWDNYFEEDTNINEIDLNIFIKDEHSDLYSRSSETHFQRGYTANEMKLFLKKAKLELVAMVDENRISKSIESDYDETSERIICIARKI